MKTKTSMVARSLEGGKDEQAKLKGFPGPCKDFG
jgi:hypothetical protein